MAAPDEPVFRSEVPYVSGEDPIEQGRYVAYINGPIDRFAEPKILFWNGVRWMYSMSDQAYRDHVYAWIGPLPVLPLVD